MTYDKSCNKVYRRKIHWSVKGEGGLRPLVILGEILMIHNNEADKEVFSVLIDILINRIVSQIAHIYRTDNYCKTGIIRDMNISRFFIMFLLACM